MKHSKRIPMALLAILLVSAPQPSQATEFERPLDAYSAVETAGFLSRGVQTLSGLTPLSGWIANRVLKREISEHVEGDLHSSIKLYSATDLLGRKVKQVTVRGENLLVEDFIPVSEFSLASVPELPLMISKGRHALLLRPVQFKVRAVMTEADMNRLLQSEKGRALLSGIQFELPPFGDYNLDLISPAADIIGDQIQLSTLVNTHGAPEGNALPVSMRGRLQSDDRRLALSEVAVQIEGMENTAPIAALVESQFSDLVNFSKLLKIKRHKTRLEFDRVELSGDQLVMEGILTVEPQLKHLKQVQAQ